MEVNHRELEQLIDDNYRTELPLYIWGATGIGKSETVRAKAMEIAKREGREYTEWNKMGKEKKEDFFKNPKKYFFLMDIRLSQLDPSDLRGLPFPDKETQTSVWYIPLWLRAASIKDARGIIFLDEINLAPPSISAAAYQLILDRELGETPLSDGVVCIGAGNRLEDQANVYDLPRPLQNRFNHVTLKTPTITQDGDDDWGAWAFKHKIDPRIITFLMQRPALLCPQSDTHSNDRAFPTPRSWGKYCHKLIQGVRDIYRVEQLASISVGTAAATEFVAHLKLFRKINLKDILEKPEKAAEIKDLDLKYSLLSLVAEWYDENYKKTDLEKVLQIANVIQAEFAILLLRFAKTRHVESFRNNVTTCKSWKPISKKYQKYVIT